MPVNINRRGRGIEKTSAVNLDNTLDNATGVTVLAGAADYVRVVHRLIIQYPTDLTAIDIDLKIDGIQQAGTPYDMWTVHNTGVITEIKSVVNTYIDPNPPTGYVICYKDFVNGVPLAEGDTIKILGNDATPANNYTSTGATSSSVIADYEELVDSVYYQGRLA